MKFPEFDVNPVFIIRRHDVSQGGRKHAVQEERNYDQMEPEDRADWKSETSVSDWKSETSSNNDYNSPAEGTTTLCTMHMAMNANMLEKITSRRPYPATQQNR